MTCYKGIHEPKDGTLVQYVGVHAVAWQPEWGRPEWGFIENDDNHTEWQPIATAPKNGAEVLLGHGNSVWVDQWIPDASYEVRKGEGGCWMMCDQWETPEIPSHWMPLPQPPDSLP